MIVTCEKCKSQYDIPVEKIPETGRTVRCAKCTYKWLQKSDGSQETLKIEAKDKEKSDERSPKDNEKEKITEEATPEIKNVATEVAEAVAEPAPEDINKPPAHIIINNPFGVNSFAFGSLVFILLISLSFLFIFVLQKPILKKHPEVAILYHAIGLNVHIAEEGFRFNKMKALYDQQENIRILKIDGKIENITKDKLPFPNLYLALKDSKGNKIEDWDLKSRSKEILSGKTSLISFQIPDISPEGTIIELKVKR